MTPNDVQRFLAMVDRSGECWLWTGAIDRDGYGVFKMDGRTRRAHRLAYELNKGVLPKGHFACHTCDRPICVRPGHLFAGTARDNNLDRMKKDRTRQLRGEDLGSVLKEEQVRRIKQMATGKRPHTPAQLAALFNVSRRTIYHILNGTTWTHVEN